MKGYVARKGDRWYAVIYEGLDPVTGRERRSWHAAGTERADAERFAARLAGERNGPDNEARSLSFGAYLTTRWLPGKRLVLATSTYDGYRRKIERHILPALGTVGLRRLRPNHLEALYEELLHPTDGHAALAPKTVYEIHLVIRGALGDAVRRGMISRNVAAVAHAPRLRSIPKVEQQAWTADQLRAFLRAAMGHRLFPALWLAATTGVRRSELLGLKWSDVDLGAATMSVSTPRRRSRSTPTSMSCRACKPMPPASSNNSLLRGSTGRRFYRFGPVEGPEEDGLKTVEAPVSTRTDQG
jgi:integrase